MFFAPRVAAPELSAPFLSSWEAFAAGDTVAAVNRLPRGVAPASADEALFLVDVGVVDAGHARYVAACAAAAAFRDPRCHIAASMGLRPRGRRRTALARIEEVAASTLSPANAQRARAALALQLAECGQNRRAREVLAGVDRSEPWACLIAARARMLLRESGVDDARAALALAPRFYEAALLLSGALLSDGNDGESRVLLAQAAQMAPRDPRVRLAIAGAFFADGDFASAAQMLAGVAAEGKRWARAAAAPLAFARLCGGVAVDDAVRAADDAVLGPTLAARRNAPPGKRVYLRWRHPVQAAWQCYPTVVAASAQLQGVPLPVRELSRATGAVRGTTTARMAAALRPRGFEFVHVRANFDAVRMALDQGVPLINELVLRESGHVELIVGYDDALGLVWIHDPMTPFPHVVDRDSIAARGGGIGSFLAIVAPGRRFDVPAALRAPEALALQELQAAVDAGDVERARALRAAIPDHGSASLAADSVVAGVLLAPSEAAARLRASLAEAPVGWLHHAALAVAAHDGPGVALRALQALPEAPGFLRAELAIGAALEAGDTAQAQRMLQPLLERAPGAAPLWVLLGRLALVAGDSAGVDAAAAVLDALNDDAVPKDARAARAAKDALIAAGDASVSRLLERAQLLFHTEADGAVIERELKKLLALRPKDPQVWGLLCRLHEEAGRDDLVRAVRAEAGHGVFDDDADDLDAAFAALDAGRVDDARAAVVDADSRRWFDEARRRALTLNIAAKDAPQVVDAAVDEVLRLPVPAPQVGFVSAFFDHLALEALPYRARRRLRPLLLDAQGQVRPGLALVAVRFDMASGALARAEARLTDKERRLRIELCLRRGCPSSALPLLETALAGAPADPALLALARDLRRGPARLVAARALVRRLPRSVEAADALADELARTGGRSAAIKEAYAAFTEPARRVVELEDLLQNGQALRALVGARALADLSADALEQPFAERRAVVHALAAATVGLETEARRVIENGRAQFPQNAALARLWVRREAFVDAAAGIDAAIDAIAAFGVDEIAAQPLLALSPAELRSCLFEADVPGQAQRGARVATLLAGAVPSHPSVAPLVEDIVAHGDAPLLEAALALRAIRDGGRARGVEAVERLAARCADEPLVLALLADAIAPVDNARARALYQAAYAESGVQSHLQRAAELAFVAGAVDDATRLVAQVGQKEDSASAAALAVLLGAKSAPLAARLDEAAGQGVAWVELARLVHIASCGQRVDDDYLDAAYGRHQALDTSDPVEAHERTLLSGVVGRLLEARQHPAAADFLMFANKNFPTAAQRAALASKPTKAAPAPPSHALSPSSYGGDQNAVPGWLVSVLVVIVMALIRFALSAAAHH